MEVVPGVLHGERGAEPPCPLLRPCDGGTRSRPRPSSPIRCACSTSRDVPCTPTGPRPGSGDAPRTVGVDATAWEVLDVVAVGGRDRTSDDVAVVDAYGRCVGVVRLADLVRALAETRVEEAAGLNPLTRPPGSDAITGEVDRRIAAGRPFALSWLDVDHFKRVDDGAGFAAGEELIRAVGRALQQAATGSKRVGHIGGDDFLVLADAESLDPPAATVLDAPWSAGGPVAHAVARSGAVRAGQRDGPPGGGGVSGTAEEGGEGVGRGELGPGPGGGADHEARRGVAPAECVGAEPGGRQRSCGVRGVERDVRDGSGRRHGSSTAARSPAEAVPGQRRGRPGVRSAPRRAGCRCEAGQGKAAQGCTDLRTAARGRAARASRRSGGRPRGASRSVSRLTCRARPATATFGPAPSPRSCRPALRRRSSRPTPVTALIQAPRDHAHPGPP